MKNNRPDFNVLQEICWKIFSLKYLHRPRILIHLQDKLPVLPDGSLPLGLYQQCSRTIVILSSLTFKGMVQVFIHEYSHAVHHENRLESFLTYDHSKLWIKRPEEIKASFEENCLQKVVLYEYKKAMNQRIRGWTSKKERNAKRSFVQTKPKVNSWGY